jgi:hypothetical protein
MRNVALIFPRDSKLQKANGNAILFQYYPSRTGRLPQLEIPAISLFFNTQLLADKKKHNFTLLVYFFKLLDFYDIGLISCTLYSRTDIRSIENHTRSLILLSKCVNSSRVNKLIPASTLTHFKV